MNSRRDGLEPRRVLLLAHTGRDEARAIARSITAQLVASDMTVRLMSDEAEAMEVGGPGVEIASAGQDPASGCELVVVLGGDGTILRAAEVAYEAGTPILGVNLGHVGFLAEAETEDVEAMIDAIIARKYSTEERLTVEVMIHRDKELVASTWALNEASVEKEARSRMLEVVLGIDSRPISRFACDGVVCATPTGSTAYNFSAGGPVVWPSVEALLIVPISAHALFARPMVVSPSSTLEVEVVPTSEAGGVLWCDGRRSYPLSPGDTIEVRRGRHPVRLARLQRAPFADRLVAKFGLHVEGWRGTKGRHPEFDVGGSASLSPPEESDA